MQVNLHAVHLVGVSYVSGIYLEKFEADPSYEYGMWNQTHETVWSWDGTNQWLCGFSTVVNNSGDEMNSYIH